MNIKNRHSDLIWKLITSLSFTIAFFAFAPNQLANVFNAPIYIGVQMTLLIGLVLLIIIAILYISGMIEGQIDRLSEDINDELASAWEDIQSDDDQLSTDGGKDDNRQSNQNSGGVIDNPMELYNRRRLSGLGALVATVIGAIVGLLFGPEGAIIGAIVGAGFGTVIDFIAGRKAEYPVSILQSQTDPKNGETFDDISNDELFDALRNRRRRYVLSILSIEDEAMDISRLAERVASLENDTPIEKLSANERKAVYVGLYQTHLPILDERGLVKYDRNRGRVEFTKLGQQVASKMIESSDKPVSWASYYIVLSILALLTLTVIKLEVPVISGLSLEIWFVVYFLMIAIPSLYQLLVTIYD